MRSSCYFHTIPITFVLFAAAMVNYGRNQYARNISNLPVYYRIFHKIKHIIDKNEIIATTMQLFQDKMQNTCRWSINTCNYDKASYIT